MDDTTAFSANVGIDQDFPAADEPLMDQPPTFGSDERRMHVRAYNYWVSLLGGRDFPSIEDLDPASIEDFGANSVLFDYSEGPANPAIPYLGRALREEGGMDESVRFMADVPARSLLSRLTEHCLEIVANRAPIGFEAEYENTRGGMTMYRGILMPFSSDDDTIDFIYGVINWKEVLEVDPGEDVRSAVDALSDVMPIAPPVAVWADGPSAAPIGMAEEQSEFDELDEEVVLGADAGLADHLAVARDSADHVRDADARSRSALYKALSHAFDFVIAIDSDPEGYAEILEDAGLKAQARAPMLPIVKLVFGADYDKTRLTEYATVLGHGQRVGIGLGALGAYLSGYEGGLKAIVASERALRRPAPATDKSEQARSVLRQAKAVATIELDIGTEEFVTLVGRRDADGRLAILSVSAAEVGSLVKVARSLS